MIFNISLRNYTPDRASIVAGLTTVVSRSRYTCRITESPSTRILRAGKILLHVTHPELQPFSGSDARPSARPFNSRNLCGHHMLAVGDMINDVLDLVAASATVWTTKVRMRHGYTRRVMYRGDPASRFWNNQGDLRHHFEDRCNRLPPETTGAEDRGPIPTWFKPELVRPSQGCALCLGTGIDFGNTDTPCTTHGQEITTTENGKWNIVVCSCGRFTDTVSAASHYCLRSEQVYCDIGHYHFIGRPLAFALRLQAASRLSPQSLRSLYGPENAAGR